MVSTTQRLAEQNKRTQKALAALHSGQFVMTPTGTGHWRVINGEGGPYTVTRHDAAWACTCPDYTEHCQSRDLHCKHIEGVRLARPTRKDTMDNDTIQSGWVRLYHPAGVQVTLPVVIDQLITTEAAKLMLLNVSNLLGAGWLVNAPGLEDGEKIEDIKHVVKRVKANDDGTETPVMDLYPDRANFRILGVYLNDEAALRAFEKVTQIKLADLPLYEGDNSIERGKGPKTDKYVTTLPRATKVIFKANPKWEGEDDKKHPKRLFVRWGEVAPSAAPTIEATPAPAGADEKLSAAQAVVMHLPVKQDPTLSGKTLGELAQSDLGQKVIRYIADTWQPNGGGEKDVQLKAAAQVLAATL